MADGGFSCDMPIAGHAYLYIFVLSYMLFFKLKQDDYENTRAFPLLGKLRPLTDG